MTSRTLDPPAPARALGWLLLMPAVLGMLITLLLPTVLTIGFSLRSGGLVGPSEFIGLRNYGQLLGTGVFWRALGFTLSVTIMPLLVAVVVAPLLAFALDRGGPWVRRAGRILLSLCVVAFSPAAVAVAWLRALRSEDDTYAFLGSLIDPATAPGMLRAVVAAATFGVVCALAVVAFLPALRGGPAVAAMVVVAAIVTLAVIATGLQLFSFGLIITGGGPLDTTQTPALLQYTLTFRAARLGPGAAVATLTGVLAGVLGVAATVLAIASGMRLTVTPRAAPAPRAPERSGNPYAPGAAHQPRPVLVRESGPPVLGVVLGAVALLAFAVVAVVAGMPWLSALFEDAPATAPPIVHVNTWLPAFAGAVVSVGVAYLGALGIGGLRPLGRRSEWLLLPFAPWLFAGSGPLSIANWNTERGLGLVNTFAALVPPLLVSVPALVVLTLLCKGLAARGGDLLSGVVLPSLPMAGILVLAVTLLNANDLLWPLLAAHRTELATASSFLFQAAGEFTAGPVDVGVATPLAVIVLGLAAAAVAQVLYLDRLALTVGRETGSPEGVRAA